MWRERRYLQDCMYHSNIWYNSALARVPKLAGFIELDGQAELPGTAGLAVWTPSEVT